jgi:DNA-binding MarR family transcriptional regulator
MPTDPFVDTLKEWFDVSMRHSMRNFLHYCRDTGLSMSHFGTLHHLHRKGCSSVTELGEHLGVTNAAASQMLDRLVQQEMITRTEDPTDRRLKQIALTEDGHRLLEKSFHARQAWLLDLAQTLSAEDKDTITKALNLLIEKARNLKQPVELES